MLYGSVLTDSEGLLRAPQVPLKWHRNDLLYAISCTSEHDVFSK
jgi:hypothetical protein